MRLVTFEAEDGAPRLGVSLADGRILDLAEADSQFEDISMLDAIREWEFLGPRAAAAAGAGDLRASGFAPSGARLLAPLPRPVSMRDGYAFRQHVETARKNRGLGMIPEFDLFPVFYFTNHLAVVGPGELRVGGERLNRLDFELACFAVIGQ